MAFARVNKTKERERDLTVAKFVGERELGINLGTGKFLGETQEKFSDPVRDPRGPVRHRVYDYVVSETSGIFQKIDGKTAGFFNSPPKI